MNIKGFEKSVAIIILLGLTLGSITYAAHIANTISQLKADSLESQAQLLTTQQQLSELSDNYSQLQNQITQGLRYTGNPFTTELWPGQLQSENITGMHWYSWNGTGLQNCTDNVLGVDGVELEGDYTTWTHVWTRDYGEGNNVDGFHVSNIGTVYSTDSGWENVWIRTYAGAEDNHEDYVFGMNFYPIWRVSSVQGKYLVAQNTSGPDHTLQIWKDGAMIWSRYIGDDTPEAFYPELVGMSPNGKYMAVGALSSVTYDAQLVMLYEGS